MNRDILLENLGLKDVNPLQCGEVYGSFFHGVKSFHYNYYIISYIMSGGFEMQCCGGKNAVKSGQIVFIKPGAAASFHSKDNGPIHHIWVGFECGIDFSTLPDTVIISAPEMKYLFLDIAGADNIRHGRELYICGKIYQVLSLLQYREAPEENYTKRYVLMALNYIETNYNNNLRVDAIAAQLNIDRAYFSKIFKQETGESPQEYIVNYRLSKAAELLSIQGLSPGEAAPRVGYNDICHFSRIFKQRYGVPPSQYKGM